MAMDEMDNGNALGAGARKLPGVLRAIIIDGPDKGKTIGEVLHRMRDQLREEQAPLLEPKLP